MHQDAQVWSRAHPFEPYANGFFTFQGGSSSHLPRALASGVRGLQPGVTARYSSARVGMVKRGARGEVFFGSSLPMQGRDARRSLQPGDVRSSLRRAPVGEGAEAHDLQPSEVLGVSAWAKARWPAGPQPGVVAMCSSACVGVGEGLVVACSSINFGRPGELLGSSVAFGSGCGQALPGVPRKAPLS